ncbi:MAG TPA: ATP-binding protein [Anaerolineales bacterium]|nr:ATP-binding protein [Anaerolineales bacterium]
MDRPEMDVQAVGSPPGPNGREQKSVMPTSATPAARGWRAWLLGLRAQLIVPYVLLTLVTAMVGTFIVTRLVTSSVRERFVNQLYEAGRVAADGIVRRERAHLETLRLMAFSAGVAEAMQAGDDQALLARLRPVAVNSSPEAVIALDLQGNEIVGLIRDSQANAYRITRGASLAGEPIVDRVLAGEVDASGDKFVDVVKTTYGTYLFTSAPVRLASDELVGVLLLGTHVNSLVAGLEAEALADIVLQRADGSLIATTFSLPQEGPGPIVLPPGQTLSVGSAQFKEFSLWSRDFQAAYSPWIARGRVLGVLGVALPSNFLVTTEATSRDWFSAIFSLATVGIIILGYRLAQGIARPILRLRSMAQTVALGNLDQTSGLHRQDEIGELAEAFDAMTARLQARTAEAQSLYAEAVERNRQLAEMYERLQAAQQQLVQSEKLAAVGQLAAGIVHDVKNPLGVIKGMAEEMLEDAAAGSGQADALQTIRDNATRANSIVTDLLVFARQSTPTMVRRDLRESVEGALRLTGFLLRKGRVEVETSLPKRPAMSVFDPQQIQQVLINLIQNAVQAMPAGGRLQVRLEPVEGAHVLSIQDEGCGIPADNLPRIFDPFFTTKPEGQGTGMGLSVSYGIITRHRGQIEVDSQVGVGSTFRIRLPIDVAEGASEPSQEEMSGPSSA